MKLSPPKPELNEAEYQRFTDLVRLKSGIEIPDVRRPDLEKVVLQSMAELSLSNPDEYFNQLKSGEDSNTLQENLVARLTIGETHFFRNRPQFEELANHVLPELIEKRRSVRRLRLWSAGCATGEEPYSLAILLKRLLPDLADWNVSILATDINRQALEKAKLGVYGAWSFREVPAGIQENYFKQTGNKYAIAAEIQSMVNFSYLNLVVDDYPSMITNTNGLDLIICRNVFIYFNTATNRRIAEHMYNALEEDGWLVVGHAEPSQEIFHQFSVRNYPGTILYQKSRVAEPPLLAPREIPAPRIWIGTNGKIKVPSIPPQSPVPVAVRPIPLRRMMEMTKLPQPPSGEVQSVLALVKNGQIEIALKRLNELLITQPLEIWIPYLLAKIQANRLELAEAEEWINKTLVQEPMLAPAHYLKGLILQELGRLDESLEALRGCIYADPKFWLGHFSMAGLLGRLEQPQKALKALNNLESLLAGQDRQALVPEGDGMTVGRLSEFVSAQKELLR